MAFFSKLREIFRECASEPETEVNELAAAIVASFDEALTDRQRLALLTDVAARHWAVQQWVTLLQDVKGPTRYPEDYELVGSHRVAMANSINTLMGYDPGSSMHRTPEEAESMRRSCELQRSRIRNELLDRDQLNQALFYVVQIKRLWKDDRWSAPGDRRWQLTEITRLEAGAYQEMTDRIEAELRSSRHG